MEGRKERGWSVGGGKEIGWGGGGKESRWRVGGGKEIGWGGGKESSRGGGEERRV